MTSHKRLLLCLGALATVLSAPGAAHAYDLERGLNQSFISAFPTALDQPTDHSLHATIELTDIAKPDLNPVDLRYAFQLGNFQLIADGHYTVEPKQEFDYGEAKAKLRIVSLDEFRTYFAVGLLGRAVAHNDEREARIDDRPASLFGIMTIELFPLDRWGGFLFNFYLDNRFFSTGINVQLYPGIQALAEGDYLHSTERDDKVSGRGGFEFAGGDNFYFQLLYTDVGAHWQVQIGTGF